MKNYLLKLSALLVLLSTFVIRHSSFAQGTAFTYQGRLADGGAPATGAYELRFALFGVPDNGSQVSGTIQIAGVPVTNGLFTTTLDFGSATFDGAARWLQISVRTNGSAGAFATLVPRQAITPTPYAIRAGNAALLNGQGPTAFAPATGSAQYVARTGDTMTGPLNLPANGLTAGANQLVLSGGKLGIGTAAPASALHVDGPDVRFVRNNHPWVFNADAAGGGTRAEMASDLSLAFAPGNAERMRIDASGNVGIGTTAPQAVLHVNNANANNMALRINYAGAQLANVLEVRDVLDGLRWHADNNANLFLDSVNLQVGANTLFANHASGNVGIGTTTPNGRLHVAHGNIEQLWLENTSEGGRAVSLSVGDSSFGPNLFMVRDKRSGGPNGNTLFAVGLDGSAPSFFDGGNVGIGTTLPRAKLQIDGGGVGLPATSGTVQSPGHIMRLRAGSNAILDLGGNSDSGFWFQSTDQTGLNANYPLLLNPNGGNIGIGTISPRYLLHVAGDLQVGGNPGDGGSVGLRELRIINDVATPNSHARLALGVSDATGGDPYINFGVGGPTRVWAMGVDTSDGQSFKLTTKNGASGAAHVADGTTVLTANASGNVGIGTTLSPSVVPLQVMRLGSQPASIVAGIGDQAVPPANATIVSMTTSSSAYRLYAGYRNGGEVFSVGNDGGGSFSGNVGIGTDGARFKLHVIDDSKPDVARFESAGPAARISLAATGSGGRHWGIESSGGSFNIADSTANADRFLIDPFGNVGIGTTSPTAKLEVNGSLKVTGAGNSVTTPVLTITGGSDVAEPFLMSEEDIPKGAVVVIDEARPGHLKLSAEPYDTRVAGIVSGAGGVQPGITLSQQGVLEGGQQVALSGRVYVQADATYSAIRPGDLLTTSAAPGHAMKVTDHAKAQGAILGKAMSRLESGQGLVLVLVTLQ